MFVKTPPKASTSIILGTTLLSRTLFKFKTQITTPTKKQCQQFCFCEHFIFNFLCFRFVLYLFYNKRWKQKCQKPHDILHTVSMNVWLIPLIIISYVFEYYNLFCVFILLIITVFIINYLFMPYTINSWWIQPIQGSLRPYITMIVFPFLTFNSLSIIWRYLTRHWRTYPDVFVLGLPCLVCFFCCFLFF